jgi:polyhydroxybutyrate depolymerase
MPHRDALLIVLVLRKLLSAGCSVSLLLALLPPGLAQAPSAAPFPDMAESWFAYRDAVSYLRGRDVVQGYPDGTFRPDAPINRAELLKLVFRGRSETDPVAQDCFADVPRDAWFAPFVCAAKRRGIIAGYPSSVPGQDPATSTGAIFKPEQTVNFAEAIKIILNAYEQDITEATGEQWFRPYVDSLDKRGILPAHSYLPWQELNRERAADLIARVLRFEEDRVAPNRSAGCGRTRQPAPPSAATVRGEQRTFLLTVPDRYLSHEPAPLIIAFHGRTNSNEQVRSYYRLDRETDDYFIAYPAALSNGNGSFYWTDPATGRPDMALFDAIVETIAASYCIDLDQIYVVGHSLGAWMANSIACLRGDVVRASATVGGDGVWDGCAGPAAAWIAHNPNDQQASFGGAERLRELRTAENACAWDSRPTEPASFKCAVHDACTDNPVVWCPHEMNDDERGQYYPHNWPRETVRHITAFFASLR